MPEFNPNSYQQAATYDSVEVVEGSALLDETHKKSSSRSYVGWAVAAMVLMAVALFSVGNGSVTTAASALDDLPLEGSSLSARACTFHECYDSNCNGSVAPFTCLRHNGGPHGGCSPTEWTPGSCSDQCDLSDCDSLEIPDDVKDCESVECSKEWCTVGQLCNTDTPYQCTGGSATFGCSTDAMHWTLRTSGSVCSVCCDTTTCE